MKDNKELKVTWIIFEAYAEYITNLYKSSGMEMDDSIEYAFSLVRSFREPWHTDVGPVFSNNMGVTPTILEKMSLVANGILLAYFLTKDRFEGVKSFDWFCHQVLSGFRDLKLKKLIDD